jgi:hypothetical protein
MKLIVVFQNTVVAVVLLYGIISGFSRGRGKTGYRSGDDHRAKQ